MKKVLKQPLFPVACICLVLAAALAVIVSVRNPKEAILAKLEQGANKNDFKKILSCMTPETQAMYAAFYELAGGGTADIFDMDGGKLHIISGASTPRETDKDGNESYSVRAYSVLYDKSGEYKDTEQADVDIIVIGGKKYLEDLN